MHHQMTHDSCRMLCRHLIQSAQQNSRGNRRIKKRRSQRLGPRSRKLLQVCPRVWAHPAVFFDLLSLISRVFGFKSSMPGNIKSGLLFKEHKSKASTVHGIQPFLLTGKGCGSAVENMLCIQKAPGSISWHFQMGHRNISAWNVGELLSVCVANTNLDESMARFHIRQPQHFLACLWQSQMQESPYQTFIWPESNATVWETSLWRHVPP